MKNAFLAMCLGSMVLYAVPASAQTAMATPTDVKPGSITCEDVPYPYAVSYLPLTLYGQDLRIAFMDVPPLGQPNGHTVVLFHGNNFAGFYFGGVIDALRNGRTSRPRRWCSAARKTACRDRPRSCGSG
jgi:hypothetical protein